MSDTEVIVTFRIMKDTIINHNYYGSFTLYRDQEYTTPISTVEGYKSLTQEFTKAHIDAAYYYVEFLPEFAQIVKVVRVITTQEVLFQCL